MSSFILNLIKGILMGAANVIPGVSGGTVAFITGIYEKLIESLNAIDLKAIKLFFTGKWRSLAAKINLTFLSTLFLGILVATFSLAKLIEYLLTNYEIEIWSFFFGLIIASSIIIIKQITNWKPITVFFLIAGIGIAYAITSLSLIRTPDTLPYLFMSGAIAIVTMILPGVSGSFMLVILDKYSYVIGMVTSITDGIKPLIQSLMAGEFSGVRTALESMQIIPLLVFMAGTIIGLLLFAKVLNWLYKNYKNVLIAFLTGFLIGSLNKVWPWKETLEWYTDKQNELQPLIQKNILPPEIDLKFLIAIGLAVSGFLIVYLVERFATPKSH
ncbi:MAG: DUF368 domain-containing protein [Bacteroidetes bacterium]|nr:DUF368 domain-containing protein [Bacteroidota bacterium]